MVSEALESGGKFVTGRVVHVIVPTLLCCINQCRIKIINAGPEDGVETAQTSHHCNSHGGPPTLAISDLIFRVKHISCSDCITAYLAGSVPPTTPPGEKVMQAMCTLHQRNRHGRVKRLQRSY